MKRIFYGERDGIDYVNQGKYAFMNWRFDNGMGANDKIIKVKLFLIIIS